MANLVLFYELGRLKVSFSVVFFLGVGLFNLMRVAPFRAFTNDVYTPEQGKRLFAIIGIGSSLGAILGAGAASRLFAAIGGYAMLLVAAALLGICMVLTNVVHRREETRSGPRPCNEPLKFNGGFQLVFKQRYLLLIALLMILSNVVNTTGEFILSASVSQHADASRVLSAKAAAKRREYRREYRGTFYAEFYFWVNLVGAGLQMFAVSRMMKYVGIGPSLFFLPMIALGSYTVLSFVPVLGLIRAAKIAENGTDYSVEKTAMPCFWVQAAKRSTWENRDRPFVLAGRRCDISAGCVHRDQLRIRYPDLCADKRFPGHCMDVRCRAHRLAPPNQRCGGIGTYRPADRRRAS